MAGLCLLAVLALPADAPLDQSRCEPSINPLAAGNSLSVQPSYTWAPSGGTQVDVLVRTVAVYRSLLLPGLAVPDDVYSLVRLDVPFGVRDVPSLATRGLGDISILDVACRQLSWITLALGWGATVPSATIPSLGTGKLQLAPAVAAVVTGLPNTRLGVLAQDFFSIAGDPTRPAIHTLSLEPLISFFVTDDTFLISDPVLQLDWLHAEWTVPLTLEVGHELSDRLALTVGPQWVVAGTGRRDLSVVLKLDYQNW